VSRIDRIRAFLDLDWTKWPYIGVLTALFMLSRVPLLNSGFGADSDAWLMANTAFGLRFSHVYHASRFPGYPLPEFVNSFVIDHGWIATNTLTMIFSLSSVFVFALILKDLNARNKGLLVLTYAFLPIVWINSSNTMDYMWALSFIVMAWFLALRNRWAFAGVMMGLAIGSRITSAILVLPFLYLVLTGERKVKNGIGFVVATGAVSLLLFVPLFLQYGLGFLTYYPAKGNLADHLFRIAYNGVYVLGIAATLFGAIFLVLSFKALRKLLVSRDREAVFLLFAMSSVGVLFAIAPLDSAYLLPAIPFGLLLANKIGKRQLVTILAVILLLTSFVALRVARNDEGNLEIYFAEGVLIREAEQSSHQLDYVHDLLDIKLTRSYVIAGYYLPILSYLGREDGIITNSEESNTPATNLEYDCWYVYLIPLDEMLALQEEGYTVYYIQNMRKYTQDVYGYDLNDYGCVFLEVISE